MRVVPGAADRAHPRKCDPCARSLLARVPPRFANLRSHLHGTRVQWFRRHRSPVPDGGYDLEPVSDTQTKVTIHNTLEGHGFGKLIVGLAVRAAIKDAPAFAQRIKAAVEAGTPGG
jgi:hypothetical protein